MNAVDAMTTAMHAHVLAVDDDVSIRQMIADSLGDYDMRVTAVDGVRAIAKIMERETIDLVILHLKLPDNGGMESARRIRDPSDVPIRTPQKEIEPADSPHSLIRTERGAGYVFTAAVEIVR